MALFALAVQFALAFGHFHAADADRDATSAVATVFDVASDNSGSPAEHGKKHTGNDFCAICATIHLTGSAQVAVAPALPIPITYRVSEVSRASEAALDDPWCFEHRSRGPPQA